MSILCNLVFLESSVKLHEQDKQQPQSNMVKQLTKAVVLRLDSSRLLHHLKYYSRAKDSAPPYSGR